MCKESDGDRLWEESQAQRAEPVGERAHFSGRIGKSCSMGRNGHRRSRRRTIPLRMCQILEMRRMWEIVVLPRETNESTTMVRA